MPSKTKATTVEVGRRPDIEDYLNKQGVTWEYEDAFDLALVDDEQSLKNQARLNSVLDDATLDTYAEAYKRGDLFPAVILHKGPRKQKAIVVDGNHRVQAAWKIGRDTHPAYVIRDAKPETITRMTFEANTKHGLPTSQEERIHHAIYLIDSGIPQAQALRMMNVPVSAFNRQYAATLAMRRALEAGVDMKTWEQIGFSQRARLKELKDDDLFYEVVDLTYRAALTSTEVDDLVKSMNGTNSHKQRRSMFEGYQLQYSERIQDNAAGAGGMNKQRRTLTPKQSWLIGLGRVVALPSPEQVVDAFKGDERKLVKAKLEEGGNKLLALAKKL